LARRKEKEIKPQITEHRCKRSTGYCANCGKFIEIGDVYKTARFENEEGYSKYMRFCLECAADEHLIYAAYSKMVLEKLLES